MNEHTVTTQQTLPGLETATLGELIVRVKSVEGRYGLMEISIEAEVYANPYQPARRVAARRYLDSNHFKSRFRQQVEIATDMIEHAINTGNFETPT